LPLAGTLTFIFGGLIFGLSTVRRQQSSRSTTA
jgi:hypothetical protein